MEFERDTNEQNGRRRGARGEEALWAPSCDQVDSPACASSLRAARRGYSVLKRALVLFALCVGAARVFAISTPAQGAVAAGGHHVLALKADGTVWSWGANDTGQLGTNDGPARGAPAQIAGLGSVAAIATGYGHSLALKIDGTVWSWGDNSSAQLGDGTQINRPTPVQIAGLTDIVAIAGGRLHSLALQSDGTLWAWGADFFRQLGDGGFMTQLRPIRITMPGPVARIVASDYASAAVLADGSVWRWGYGAGPVFPSVSVPTRVADLPFATEVALGFGHLVARTPNGDVWSVGTNDSGQLGIGNAEGSAASRPNGLGGVTMLAVNTGTNFALLADGSLRAWGSNIFGALGDGTKTNRLSPIPTGGAGHYVAIAAGENFAVALDDAGGVWQWGRNDAGQSGDGASQQLGRLVQVPKFDHLLGVSLTAKSGAVLKSGGTVWTLGGDAVPNLADVAAIAIGTAHSAALKSDGTVWTWGANQFGQLGDGSSTYNAVPVGVSGGSGAVAIDVGLDHSMMLKNDGSVWSWGGNNNYQLGDGTKVPRSIPVLSTVAPGAVGIGAGFGYSVAIKPDGTVARWGLNGTTVIPGLSGIVGVSAGNNHALAVKNDGTVWGWGDNTYGQLGVGNAGGYYSSGVQVPGLSGIVEVAAGATHSVARRNDGQVFAWGQNGKGALGDGSSTSRSSPVAVTPNIAARSIAAGDEVTALVRTDGTLWAAGDGVVFNWDTFALRIAAVRLVANAADLDGDGMNDSWEIAHFGGLSHHGTADTDGDGLTDIRESLVGTDPLAADTDGDGRMDGADIAPLDYYDGLVPTLAIVAGDNQISAPGAFTPLALDVGVWSHAGTEPLVNAPVTFTVASGGGKLATAIGGTLSDTLTLRSDSDGSAQAFFQQPATAGVASKIDVIAGLASVRFQSTSANTGPTDQQDSDQDGLPDSWEIRYFATLDFGPTDQFSAMDRTLLDYYQQGIAPRWANPVVAGGLRAWYRSGELYFYDENSGGMRTWADLSGNGFHLRQNDPEKQPQLYWSESGDSLVYFTDGQSLSTEVANILGGATDFTILVTFRPDSPARATRVVATFGQAGSDGFQFAATEENHALTWTGATDGVVQGSEVAVPAMLDVPQQISIVKSGTTQTVYLNGQAVASGTVAAVPRVSPSVLKLGGAFNGGIIELQIFDRALPEPQRETAEDALLDHAQLSDSDHNNLSDRWERRYFGGIGTNPEADADGDGVSNRIEFNNGTDPTATDTDGDGFSDGEELALGTDPKDPASKGAAQLIWLSKQTNTSWVDGYTLPGPGLRGFDWDSTNYYRDFEWRLIRSGSPDADGSFTFTATMPNQEHPDVWRFDNRSGGDYEWHAFPSGVSTSDRGFIGWEVNSFFNARGNYLSRALSSGGSSSERNVTWHELGFYSDETGVVRSYNNDYSVSLSSPSVPISVPAESTSSESGWDALPPTASRSGQNTTSAVYHLVVPTGVSGTAYWFEIFTPATEGKTTYTARSWKISGEKSPAYALPPPGLDGSVNVSPVIMNLSLAVDANRDGRIETAEGSGSDITSPDSPYRFWINDDIDRGHTVDGNDFEQDDISPTEAATNNWVEDWKYNTAQSLRDLEDFSRIVVSTSGLSDAFRSGDLYLGLKWADTTGTPSIKLYKQYDATGGTSYLTDDYQASVQLPENAVLNQRYPNDDVSSMSAHTVVTPGDPFVLPQGLWIGTTGDIRRSLLFEGCTAGKGQLKLVILKKDGTDYTEIGEGPGVWLDLKSVEDFYERWTAGDGNGGDPDTSAARQKFVNRSGNSVIYDTGFVYPADAPEEQKYILYVHGWNMQPEEKNRFAETAFKRLYWQGYKGRFGVFCWPTTYNFGALVKDDSTVKTWLNSGYSASTDPTNYDRGEWTAWKSSFPLMQLLASLRSSYPNVNVIAHSMGNIVTGEALRRLAHVGATNVVDCYVASQAALPAHSYDGTVASDLFADVPLATLVAYTDGGHPETPNIYPDWLAESGGAAGRRVNFYNVNDFALWHDAWEANQFLKPDGPDDPDQPWTYKYLGEVNVVQDLFKRRTPVWSENLHLGDATIPENRWEIMAFAAEARSRAVGATDSELHMDRKVDLQTIWPDDTGPRGSDGQKWGAHKWHSAQFRSTNMRQANYWRTLLSDRGFNLLTAP